MSLDELSITNLVEPLKWNGKKTIIEALGDFNENLLKKETFLEELLKDEKKIKNNNNLIVLNNIFNTNYILEEKKKIRKFNNESIELIIYLIKDQNNNKINLDNIKNLISKELLKIKSLIYILNPENNLLIKNWSLNKSEIGFEIFINNIENLVGNVLNFYIELQNLINEIKNNGNLEYNNNGQKLFNIINSIINLLGKEKGINEIEFILDVNNANYFIKNECKKIIDIST